jgi:hypothetical protein
MTQKGFEPKTVRIFTSFHLTDRDREFISSGFQAKSNGSKLHFNQSGPCDLVVVLNFSRGFKHASGEKPTMVKWLMEPKVEGRPNWRYTYVHSKIFSKIYSHASTGKDEREHISPPLVPPHVPVEDVKEILSRKTKLISAIGSVQTALPFHKTRKVILDDIQNSPNLGIDVFGKGRNFIAEKSEGLYPYRYSIAIENSLTPHYWTEKLADCFISLTVPIYLGAQNVKDYFPEESFIAATEQDLKGGLENILRRISTEDYERRLPFLLEARRLVVEDYNLGTQIASMLVEIDGNETSKMVVYRVWTLDTFIFRSYEFADRILNKFNNYRQR